MKSKQSIEDIWNPNSLQEGRECIGVVTDADFENGEYGVQLHIQIRPEDYEPQGRTRREHEWYSPSKSRNSKWGYFIQALSDLGLDIKSEEDLIGKKFRWEKKKLKIGQMETNPTWMPTELIESEEDQHNFSELDELLEEGISKKEIIQWARKKGIPKRDVNEYLDDLLLVEEDGELFLDE